MLEGFICNHCRQSQLNEPDFEVSTIEKVEKDNWMVTYRVCADCRPKVEELVRAIFGDALV